MTTADIQIDPRGYRFGAGVTAVVAIVALLLGGGWGSSMALVALVALFTPGATIGPQATLQSFLFKRLIRPRIGPPADTESFRPPRFAQQMGLAMSMAGAALGFAGLAWGAYLFAGLILFASFLNSAFGFCLGCEIYLAFKRLTAPKAA